MSPKTTTLASAMNAVVVPIIKSIDDDKLLHFGLALSTAMHKDRLREFLANLDDSDQEIIWAAANAALMCEAASRNSIA